MVRVGRALCGSPSPTPCPSRVTQRRLHRTASRRGLNIPREGDSTTSLGSLDQGSVTLRGKKFFLIFSWSFLCFSLCPLPLVLSLDTTAKSLAHSSFLFLPRGSSAHLPGGAHRGSQPAQRSHVARWVWAKVAVAKLPAVTFAHLHDRVLISEAAAALCVLAPSPSQIKCVSSNHGGGELS